GLRCQYPLDRGFHRLRKRRMSSLAGMLANVFGESLSRPHLGGIPEFLRLATGHVNHPGFGLFGNHRCPGSMIIVFQGGGHAHGQSLCDPFADAGARHLHRARNRGNVFPGVVAPENSCPLHFSPRGRLRIAQFLKLLSFLRGQSQPRTLGLARHGPSVSQTFLCEYVLLKRYTRTTNAPMAWWPCSSCPIWRGCPVRACPRACTCRGSATRLPS